MNTLRKNFHVAAWVLGVLVLTIGFTAWSQNLNWQLDNLSGYKFFPVLGVSAFSLMWTQYILSALAKHFNFPAEMLKKYFNYTSYLVLIFILLHPGILIWSLWRDGFGLPPQSYLEHYVAAGSRWAAIIASISLTIFLAYEFHRKFGKKSWWKYVGYATDLAMIGIFFHALELGGELQSDWFRYVWFFYGISYLVSIFVIYTNNHKAEVKS